MDLAAFKTKAMISVALYNMSEAGLALRNMECSPQGRASLHKGQAVP